MSSIATTQFRKNRKGQLVDVCGGSCNICGYHKSIAALEFHHIDPSTKKYTISAKGTCHNIEADLQEVSKCILVCANCHREIHNSEYTDIELLKMRIYDEDKAQNLLKQIEAKKHSPQLYCNSCGAVITKYSDTCKCIKCAHKNVNKPTREELKDLVFNFSFEAVGRQYHVSGNAVKKWCMSYNLPNLRSVIRNYTKEQWEEV